MNVQITKHHVDKENKILEIEIECRTSRSHTEPKLRGSLVFDAGCGRRYFPVVAGNQQENGQERQYLSKVSVDLSYVFFEKFPEPSERVKLSLAFCEPESLWSYEPASFDLPGELFIRQLHSKNILQKAGSVVLYGICTLLLPVWLLDGVLAVKGLHPLHEAAAGRHGKSAVIYHAHGLVHDLTGYGYSVREYKTGYFKKCYEHACRKVPQTKGILFLSERRVENGGNLDRIRACVQEKGLSYREFLTETPVHKLSRKQIRECAEMVAEAKLIILEDFVPQLHALTMRPETQILQMWHACGAFKLFGLSELGVVDHLTQSSRNHRSYTAALASSRGVVPFYSEAFGIDERCVRPVGVPRTDVFFDTAYREQIREALYTRYPVCRDKKVILFAPTFRGSGNKTAYYPWEKFSVEKLMRELPQESVLILKNHPFVRDCCEIPEEYQDRVLDLSREENINDLLFITSVLITDYSSVIFEAVLLNIPILFYTFDLQEYLEKRDLYFEFAAFAPGKIISDMEALIKAAAGLLDDPTEETSPAMTKTQFQRLFLDALDGHSTQRTMQLVEELLATGD